MTRPITKAAKRACVDCNKLFTPGKGLRSRCQSCENAVRRKRNVKTGDALEHSNMLAEPRWRKLRKLWLIDNPFCVECLKTGCLNDKQQIVDHIIPPRGNQQLFYDQDNWQTLCKRHHDMKTVNENGGFGFKRIDRENL